MATEPKVKPKPQETSRLTPCGQETIMDLVIKFTCDEAGASAVEYAFLVAFIAVAIAASVITFGTAVKGLFDNAVAKWPGG
jgi:Flp pilus assembly pilin Flp